MNLQTTLATLIRHGLTILTGYLVTRGTIDGSTATVIIGAASGVGAIAWSFIQKAKVVRQIEAAFDTPTNASESQKANVLAGA